MNLSKLFKIQKQLDERIVKEKGLEGQDLLDKKILALQVELGELANEWRGFKFWSHDQEPRTEVPDFETWKKNGHKTYKGKPIMHFKNPLLEEYVDCLHFILSIGNELGCQNVKIDSDYTEGDAVDTFNLLFYTASETWTYIDSNLESYLKTHFGILLAIFIGLGEKHLGFTWEQVEQAYLAKNKINHERLESGY